jgi:hypothetical protein
MGDTSNIKPHKAPENLVVKIQKRVGLELLPTSTVMWRRN